MLRFSEANAKIKKLYKIPELQRWLSGKRKVYSFDLLSGWSCPFAQDCLSRAVEINGKRKIKDGKQTKFRCFSASQEAQYDGPYNLRKGNFSILRVMNDSWQIAQAINNVMPKNLGVCRIHVAGDFFNWEYMYAWFMLAQMNKDRLFYAYTKSLPYWLQSIDDYGKLDNLVLTASYGGRHDDYIAKYNLRSSKVVFSEAEADNLGLEIDHDDSHAARPDIADQDFALLIHGTQPPGSDAGKAVRALRGKGSYGRKVVV